MGDQYKQRAGWTNLHDAVEGAGELAGSTLADIDGKTGTGKVKRVHDQEGGGTSKTACMSNDNTTTGENEREGSVSCA